MGWKLLIIVLCIATSPLSAAAESGFARKKIQVGDQEFGYRLLAPLTIVEEQRYPVVLFLHGAGERGSDNEKQLAYLPKELPKLQDQYPCFVVAPQCPAGARWAAVNWSDQKSEAQTTEPTLAMRAAVEALRTTIREQPVDLDRIYLTGLSMGGYGAWDLALRQPDFFAAVVPICGGGDERRVHRILSVPTAVYHGADDTVVPVARSRTLVKRLGELGAKPDYHELEGVGHNAWGAAYRAEKAISWMFSQRRSSNPLSGVQALCGPGSPLNGGERIVFLGDSITESGVRPGGYVQLIEAAFQKGKENRSATVVGAGISGHKVPDLQARLDRDVIAKRPSLVFIYIGINDVWHSQSGNGTSKEDYESGLRDLIQRLRASPTKPRIILATPTVIGEKKQGSNSLDSLLDSYADISRKVARERKVHLCDLRKATVEYLSLRNHKNVSHGVLTTDGVHLNAEGNRFVANHAALSIFEALSR